MTAAERKPKSVSQIYVEALCYGKGLWNYVSPTLAWSLRHDPVITIQSSTGRDYKVKRMPTMIRHALNTMSFMNIEELAAMAKGCTHVVLHYMHDTPGRMQVWRWWGPFSVHWIVCWICPASRPSSAGLRLGPSQIQEHRKTNTMLGPGCLCPLMDLGGPAFVEAAIYMVRKGPLAGQYIASCARDVCGYIGKPPTFGGPSQVLTTCYK